MEKVQKDLLYWFGIIFVIVLSFYLIVSTRSKLHGDQYQNAVTFQGQGKVSSVPDVAVVNFSVVTQGRTAEEAKNANSKKTQAITAYLEKHGVPSKDYKVTGYSLNPQYDYPQPIIYRGGEVSSMPVPIKSPNVPTISSYQVYQSFELKIRNIDDASEIVDGLVRAGANDVNGLRFVIDDPASLKDQARKMAIEDAKRKAKELEETLGVRLGKLISFNEDMGGYPIPYYDYAMTKEGYGGGGMPPSLPVGENEVVVNIMLTYQLR